MISLIIGYLGHDGLVILNIVHVVAHPSLGGMRCGPLVTVVVHERRGNSMLLLLLLLDVMLVV